MKSMSDPFCVYFGGVWNMQTEVVANQKYYFCGADISAA